MYYVRHNYVYSRDKYALLGASGWRYSLPSCCNNSLYKLGFFLYDIAVDELLLDLYFCICKSMLEFSTENEGNGMSIIMVCNTLLWNFFFFPLLYV